jgi:hypothetical protein
LVRLIASIAGALLIVAVGVACGGGDNGAETRDDVAQVRTAVESVERAMHEGDWPKLYTLFDGKTREQCGLDRFVAAGPIAAQFFTGLSIEVTDISVQGDTATVDLSAKPAGWEATPSTWDFVREDGEWRLRWDLSQWCALPNSGGTPGPTAPPITPQATASAAAPQVTPAALGCPDCRVKGGDELEVTAADIQLGPDGKYYIPDRGDGCAYRETYRGPVPWVGGVEVEEVMLWAPGCEVGWSYHPATGRVNPVIS